MAHNNTPLTNNRYRLGFHVMAPSGWMNDPNGFCYFKGYYHIFYQYHPHSPHWGPMHWGHARSKDLIHWENLPTALIPGDPEDKDGCFSGSAVVKDDVMYLFYTGHHYYDDGDPEHFWQNQNMAYSTDGVTFQKYENNPIIQTAPEDNTHHFRDPKVWQHDDIYYMIIGSQNTQKLGRAILYKSQDLKQWDYVGAMSTSVDLETEGFMWECPDFFSLNGKDIFLFSPQGIKEENEKHLNLYNLGYFVGQLDYATGHYSRGDFQELDKGFDFYATQTTETPDGRRIAFAWMAMWENNMPEQEDGWSGALTLPRELTLKDDHLYMNPVAELKGLRTDAGTTFKSNLDSAIALTKNAIYKEILLKLDDNHIDFKLSLKNEENHEVVTLAFNAQKQQFILARDDREDQRFGSIKPCDAMTLQLLIDKSSLEIFINGGETVFSTRFYSEEQLTVWLESISSIAMTGTVYSLNDSAIQF